MEMNEVATAGLSGWPLAFTLVGMGFCFVSLFHGWPWQGVIVHKHYHDGEEDEDE
jgi:hypothetical protein